MVNLLYLRVHNDLLTKNISGMIIISLKDTQNSASLTEIIEYDEEENYYQMKEHQIGNMIAPFEYKRVWQVYLSDKQ
jgi:hypothetical protein